MGTQIFRGNKKPLLQNFTRKWSPSQGYIEEAVYRSFSTAEMQRLYLYMTRNGFETEWVTERGVHVLHAVDTSGANTIDTWEIALNKLQTSTFKNPRNTSAITGANMNDIMAMYRGDIRYAQVVAAITARGGQATALALAQRVNEGSDSYSHSGYVLRHTTNVSNRYRRNISDVGVDMLYDRNRLMSEVIDSRSWVYPLPGRLQFKILAIMDHVQLYFPARSGHQWTWIKCGSTESTAANNRVNITSEFELGPWSTYEYQLY
jgi:hypothetical protein